MYIAILTSTGFDETNQPLIRNEIKAQGHSYKVFCDLDKPFNKLLDFDVVWDRSAIIDDCFFKSLDNLVPLNDGNAPLLVNSPKSIMNSYNKIRTHFNIGKYEPLTIIYDGKNFEEILTRFHDEEYVVLKEPMGWQAKGTKRIKTTELSPKILRSNPILVQKYIEPNEGINRALTLYYNGQVKPIAWYTRIPQNSWRTGADSISDIVQITPTSSMIEFVSNVASSSKLFLNGIDYISKGDQHYLLEVNSVPRLSTAVHNWDINAPQECIKAMEEVCTKK